MGYDILILTDHSGHTSENSAYALASGLAAHPSINSVDIASRGLAENGLFFDGNMEAILTVIPAIPRLTYKRALHLFETGSTESEIVDYDFVLLRLPPPIPAKLFRMLPEAIPEDHIINEPSGIIRTSSKAFLLEVADLCPPMQIVKKQTDVISLLATHPTLVLKPFFSYAGQGVVKIVKEHVELGTGERVFHRPFFKQWKPPYLAMQFLPKVSDGDKRTIVVNGKIMGSALRKPAPGQWMCNVSQGGKAVHATTDKGERIIAERLLPVLAKFGIVIYGFDTLIGNEGTRVLSEINSMSLGGLKQVRDESGKPILKKVVASLVAHMDHVWYGES